MRVFFAIAIFVFVLCSQSFAQVCEAGEPLSLTMKLPIDKIPIVAMDKFDVGAMMEEDRLNEGKNIPFRFAKEFCTNIDLLRVGTMNEVTGGRIYRLRIESTGAFSLHFVMNPFFIPEGGRLFIYNEQGTDVLGAITAGNNNSDKVLATRMIDGGIAVIEYFEPSGCTEEALLTIKKVYHSYRNFFNENKDGYYGHSGTCNVDVNCPDASSWQAEKHAVCRLAMGHSMCSGTLINNTSNNGRPYFLTAEHCIGNSSFSEWVFYFNYESPMCDGPDGSVSQTMSGCQVRATTDSIDFCLVEMSAPVPPSYLPYYAGWNRGSVPPTSSVCIHHPSADVKKYSKDLNPATEGTYGTGEYGQYRHWKISEWDLGTTEGGSSGSPLFDQNRHIVGTLTGGDASCSYNFNDFYSRFDVAWDYYADSSKQLKYWLDPINAGTSAMGSYDPYLLSDGCDSLSNFSGTEMLYQASVGGYMAGNNQYGDLVKAEYFVATPQESSEIDAVYIKFGAASGTDSIDVSIWNAAFNTPSSMVCKERISIQDVAMNVAANEVTPIPFFPKAYISGAFFVCVELPSTPGNEVAIITNNSNETSVSTAWEKSSDGIWHNYEDTWGLKLNHYIAVSKCIATNTQAVIYNNVNQFNIYPNPASNQVTIDLNDIAADKSCILQISDSQGRQVKRLVIRDSVENIDLSSLREGLYIFNIFTDEKVYLQKVVITR